MTAPTAYRPATVPATDMYLSVDGWTVPAIDADGTEWIGTELSGWTGPPAPRLSTVERPRRHGVFDGASFYGARTITIDGTALARTRVLAIKAMDTLASVAAWDSTNLYPLNVTEPGQPTRQCMVRLGGETKVQAVHGGLGFDFSLQLLAPDPRRYDAAEQQAVLSLPVANPAGLTAPVTAPLTVLNVGTSTNRFTALNAGTTPSPPTVTLYGPLIDPRIANATTGLAVALSISLLAGDFLVLDFNARTVMLGGTASRAYALAASSAWWEMVPGPNDIVFTGGGGSGTAVIKYRSAWL